MDEEADTTIRPEIDEYPEAGPFWVGLWAVARHWVALLDDIFEPDLIATTGITRSFALRCNKWLWSIEGLVRRLIIAAALKRDTPKPATLTPSELTKGKERPSVPAKPASASFIVLPRVPGRSTHTRDAHGTAQPPPEHRHLAVRGDDLLNLFPRHTRRNAPQASRHALNPLQRRCRRSRWDPDYQGSRGRYQVIEEGDVVYTSFMIYGRQLTPLHGGVRPEPRPRNHTDRSSPYWKPPGGDVPEWKRIELEWERVIPSPRIAGRIRALIRVLEHPERWVERTARRLHATPGLIDTIRSAPPPRFRKHKLDRGPPPPFDEPLAEAQALIDTS
jgi:hypothetical protein